MLEAVLETPKMSSNRDEILAAALVMTDELHALLLHDAVFRMVVVEGPTKRRKILMSCGGLLARLHRLQQQRNELTTGQQIVLNALQEQSAKTIHDMSAAFHLILQREAKTRVDNFSSFLDEGVADRAYFFDEYSVEIRNRQRLAEVIKVLGNDLNQAVAQELTRLDAHLRTLCRPAAFIWEAELESVYPADQYWYLYLEPAVE